VETNSVNSGQEALCREMVEILLQHNSELVLSKPHYSGALQYIFFLYTPSRMRGAQLVSLCVISKIKLLLHNMSSECLIVSLTSIIPCSSCTVQCIAL
jgi:hypothetical protein